MLEKCSEMYHKRIRFSRKPIDNIGDRQLRRIEQSNKEHLDKLFNGTIARASNDNRNIPAEYYQPINSNISEYPSIDIQNDKNLPHGPVELENIDMFCNPLAVDLSQVLDDFYSKDVYESSEDNGSSDDQDESDNVTSFIDNLRECFVNIGMQHSHGNKILRVRRTHEFFKNLPVDTRALLQTPRTSVPLASMDEGEYLHFGFKESVKKTILRTPVNEIPENLLIDISTDGVRVDVLGRVQLWLIQIRIANIPGSTPEIVGIYRGSGEPRDPNHFFERFNDDVVLAKKEGGIE